MQIIMLIFVYVKAIIFLKKGKKLQLELGKGGKERKRNNLMNMALHRIIFSFPWRTLFLTPVNLQKKKIIFKTTRGMENKSVSNYKII